MSPRALLLAVFLAAPGLAPAHETLHEIERGRAIGVKVYEVGEVMAGAPYQVFSPADPRIPWQEGRTDRGGWLAFVPDVPGSWRVKVIDDTGHGIDLRVEAGGVLAAPAPAGSGAAFLLRPLLGLAVIGAVFAALYVTYRRKGTRA